MSTVVKLRTIVSSYISTLTKANTAVPYEVILKHLYALVAVASIAVTVFCHIASFAFLHVLYSTKLYCIMMFYTMQYCTASETRAVPT
jgi:fatty-acid desaturase